MNSYEKRTPHKESPPRPQNPEILSKCTIPEIKAASTKIHRFCQLQPQLYPAVVRKATRFLLTTESRQTNRSNRGIARHLQSDQRSASGSMRIGSQTNTGRQYVLMTDASFRASGYALMIEEENDKKLNSKKKTFAPVAFGSKVFSPAQRKMSIYCKEFLTIYHAFLEYSHILWGTTLPTLVMTDNRSVTRIFQKSNPPTLWNACDYVQFNFHVMHVAGTQNTAADFLTRIDLNPKERVELKIKNDITILPIQVNLQYADEEQLLYLPDETIATEEEIILQKEQARQTARDELTTKTKLAIQETTPIPINKASYTFGAMKDDARIRVKQD